MCGLFFGALGLGNLSDAIGRKNTMLVSVIGSVIVNTGRDSQTESVVLSTRADLNSRTRPKLWK